MKQTVKCQFCGTVSEYETAANVIIYCPKCRKLISSECEYGFGPVTPCTVYLGENEIAKIILKDRYVLVSDYFGIEKELKSGYENLEVYSEAERYITDRINERFDRKE